jgi:hypothetical protein
MPDEMMVFLLLGLIALIPIIAILTSHQQRMAKILRSERQPQGDEQHAQPRQEIADLRRLMAEQAIALDDLRSSLLAKKESEEALSQRLR